MVGGIGTEGPCATESPSESMNNKSYGISKVFRKVDKNKNKNYSLNKNVKIQRNENVYGWGTT